MNTSTTYHHASQVEQYGVIDEKSIPSVKLAIAKNRERRNPILLYVLFSVCVLLLSCNPDRPNFEPSYSGAPPEEDLDQYLDTKAVFIGLDEVKGVRNQLDSLLTLTDKLKNYDDDIALVYADTAYSMATEKNWQLSRGIASYYIALLKGRREHYGEGIEDALVDAKISEQIFEGLNEQEWLARGKNLIGIFYYRKDDLNLALENLDEAMEIVMTGLLSREDSLILKGELLHDLANVYKSGDSLKASKFFQESIKLYELTENKAAAARLEYDWAQLYYNQEEYDMANKLMKKGLDYAIQFNDVNAIITGYQNMGRLKFKQYRSSGEELYFREALKSYRKCFLFQKENLYFLYNQMGKAYQQRAFRSENLSQVYAYVDSAIVSYRHAMDEARIEGVLPTMREMGESVSTLCNWRSKSMEGRCTELLGMPVSDFLNTGYAGIISKIGENLQVANQRNRIHEVTEIQTENQQRSKLQWIVTVASLVLLALIFTILFQQQQQKRLKAKMEALRAQINPHFISNSLNAIESLVNLDKKEEAAK